MTDTKSSTSLEKMFVANNQSISLDKNSKSNTLKINNNCINNSLVNNSDQTLSIFNANTKSTISQSNQSFQSSIDSNDSNFSDFCRQKNNNDIKQRNNNISDNNKLNSVEKSCQNSGEDNCPLNSVINQSINSLNTFDSNTSLNVFDDNICEQQNNNNTNNNNNNNVINNTFNNDLKSDSLRDNKRLILKEKKRILKELDKTNGYINRNCINSDHIVNPLLDTINTLTSCSDSSDECDISKKCYNRSERHRRIFNGTHRHLNRKSCNYYYSSSDGDSVSNYTGTNSLESGYKSDYLGSNTPEVIDGSSLSSLGTALDCGQPSVVTSVTEAVNQAISHQMTGKESSNTLKKKNGSKQASMEPSVKNSFETNISNNQKNSNKCNELLIEKQNQNQTPDDISSNASVDSFQTNSSTTYTNNSRKTVGMFGEKIANRLKQFNNDSQLEHLLKLRKSLLKALKRCEQISSPANSRDGSPITAGISVSSRSSSPASTVVKNCHNNGLNNSSNSRRLSNDITSSDKCRQKSVSSPLTIRSHEELERSCDQLSTYSINSLDSSSNTKSNTNNNQNNSKSVRFNGSVRFSSVANQKEVQSKTKTQITGNYVSNKSILKDPLCETLRSSIKAGEFKNNCSLEGEIDELLYGRTGPYYYSPSIEASPHLVGMDDCLNPSSSAYVSRIEEKYRTFSTNSGHTGKQSSGMSSAATSKKTSASASKGMSEKISKRNLNYMLCYGIVLQKSYFLGYINSEGHRVGNRLMRIYIVLCISKVLGLVFHSKSL